jgi:hypothetical protein
MNEMSIITHIPTQTHFFISVRQYPGLAGDPETHSRTNYLAIVADAQIREFHGERASRSWQTLQVEQLQPGHRHEKRPFTFLVSEYFSPLPASDPYGKAGSYDVIRYLTDLRPDDDSTNASGKIFQVSVAIPQGLEEALHQRFKSVIEDFLQNHLWLNQATRRGQQPQRW